MSHVQITSKNASYICYTVSGSLPVCEERSIMFKRLEIHGSTGNTIPINADSVLRIIGCNDITSTPIANTVSTRSTVFYYISKEAEPVYFIPADGTIINHNTKIFIESAYSNIICYTLDGTAPACHPLGDVCEHGTRISNFNGHTTLITADTTVKAIGCTNTLSTPTAGINSNIGTAHYTIQTVPNRVHHPTPDHHQHQVHLYNPEHR